MVGVGVCGGDQELVILHEQWRTESVDIDHENLVLCSAARVAPVFRLSER